MRSCLLGAVVLGILVPAGQASAATELLLAAGDIASCGGGGDEQTAALLAAEPDASIVTLGDNVYDDGTPDEFAECYDPSDRQHVGRAFPAPGNHDYNTSDAEGYFDYFQANGRPTGNRSEGWYSFDLGDWHLVSLNSNCGQIGGCERGSPQGLWLAADLEANPAVCTLAYWHHPRFSSGENHGSDEEYADLWAILDEHDADVVLVGHDHLYERFAPQDAAGTADPRGIREFVVGTGGRSHYGFAAFEPNHEAGNGDTFGVLKLTLRPTSYTWEFVPVAGESLDAGSADCVGGTGGPPADVDLRVAVASDDAQESPKSGKVKLAGKSLSLGKQTVGLRFAEAGIPAGAQVESAEVEFQVAKSGRKPAMLVIAGELGSASPTFAEILVNVSSRTQTNAKVPWSPDEWRRKGKAVVTKSTPDLAAIIEELAAAPGWSEHSAVTLIFTGQGKRGARGFEGDPLAAPRLRVELAE